MDEEIQEVITDADDDSRIELVSDGHVMRLGHDIENDRYMEFLYESIDGVVERIKTGSSTAIKTRDGPDPNYYCVWNTSGHGSYIVYDEDGVVLRVNDHELGPLYRARGIVHDYRQPNYDVEQVGEAYLDSVVDDLIFEIREVNAKPDHLRYDVQIADGGRFMNKSLYQDLKEDECITHKNLKIGVGEVLHNISIDVQAVEEGDGGDE